MHVRAGCGAYQVAPGFSSVHASARYRLRAGQRSRRAGEVLGPESHQDQG